MAIPTQQARAIFTNAYMEKFKELVPAPSFLKSFFTEKTYTTKSISIEVRRGTEKIAVDVQRGVDGQRNKFSLSTEKQFVPPFYNENFDATSLDRYDVMFGQDPSTSPATIGYLATDIAEKYAALREKIERAKELQCAQVFETGVVTLTNGDNIDFKRKATSLVDLTGAGGYWSTAATDVDAQLAAAAAFIRNSGKNAASQFNLTMSSSLFATLKKTDWFKANAGYFQVKLMDIVMPQKNSTGASYNGTISAAGYIFNLWIYDEVYENSSNVMTAYWNAKKAFVTPVTGTRFEIAHAGIPAIITDLTKTEYNQFIVNQASDYWLNNYIDNARKAHIFELYSAPLAIPVSVDMIYTMQCVA